MENLQYKDDKLCILDQRLLPNEEKWIEIKNKEQHTLTLLKIWQ